MTKKQVADRLIEIKEGFKEQIWEVRQLLRNVDKHTKDRAESYWVPQIETAIDKDHNWLGGCMCSMEDTINSLDYEEEEEEYEDD